MNQLEEEIVNLKGKLADNIYNLENHDKLIEILRVKQNWDELQVARIQKLYLVTFTYRELSEWLEDLQKIGDSKMILAFYDMVVKDYPTVIYWSKYLEYAIDLAKEKKYGLNELQELFTRALNDIMFDFKNCHIIWRLILQYMIDEYKPDNLQMILSLFKAWLSQPHEKLDESFQFLSQFLSRFVEQDYQSYILPMNKIYANCKKKIRYYEYYEIKLLNDSANPETWIEYLNQVNKYNKPHEFANVSAIFERSIQVHDDKWIPVWLAYCYILYDKKDVDLNSFLLKFVRSYPNHAISYAEFIRNCQEIEIYQAMRNRIDVLDLMHNNLYDQWKILALSILSFDKNQIDEDGNNLAQLYQDLLKFIDFALVNNDLFHSVEKLAITIFQQLGDLDQAQACLNSMLENFENQYDLWIYALNFYQNNYDYMNTHQLFLKAIEKVTTMDWPERIIEEWLQFEQFQGTRDSYCQAILLANKTMKEIDNLRIEKTKVNGKRPIDQVDEIDNEIDDSHTKKQKLIEEPKRSREKFSIKVTNIPESVIIKDLHDFFEECGTIRDASILETDPRSAIIEFTNEQEIFTALTKNLKSLKGQEITVTRLLESTLFVSNYPPSYSQDQIRTMFDRIGTTVGIRFPSQKITNRTRRFCYVEFSNSNEAKQAILTYDGKEFEDELNKKKYTLVVTISDPSFKKIRGSPLSDKKVRVTNIPFEYDQDKIVGIFQNFQVDQVTIPKVSQKRSKSHYNDGIAIVLFKSIESAQEALKLDGTESEGRTIHVAKVINHKPEINDSQARINRFTEVSTIGITNVDSSLTSEQLQVHFQKLIGPVKKVELFPQHNASLIEFESVSDAGKAGMLTENVLNDKTLQIVSKSDIFNLVNGKQQPVKLKTKSMVPPALLRRRK